MHNNAGYRTCNTPPLTRQVIDSPFVEECGLFRDYEKCNDCDGRPTHYAHGECVTICQSINGDMIKVVYRVVDPNGTTSDPIEGTMSNPRTWVATTMCQFMDEVITAIAKLSMDVKCSEKYPSNGATVGG